MKKLGEKIKEPNKVIMNLAEVYCYDFINGRLSLKELVNLYQERGYITLEDISNLYPDSCYKVINETALGGEIYRYNNYGNKEWIKIGEMYGYA